MDKMNVDQPIIDIYLYETSQMLENLEQLMISSEKNNAFSEDGINEIFRIMHSIKGSSAMMMFNEISHLAHVVEDIFFVIRKDESVSYDLSTLIDLILESVDFFKIEVMKIKSQEEPDGNPEELVVRFNELLATMKPDNQVGISQKSKSKNKKEQTQQQLEETNQADQKYYISPSVKSKAVSLYKAKIWFKEKSEMENIRCYTIVHNMAGMVIEMHHNPKDIISNDDSIDVIRNNGFEMVFKTEIDYEEIKTFLEATIFLKELQLEEIDEIEYERFSISHVTEEDEEIKIPKSSKQYQEKEKLKEAPDSSLGPATSTMISVNVDKLDMLMDTVGELVIAEAMVTQNPEVAFLEIESFDKAARQLHKITTELQDMVMAIRMVPLSTTFMKMHRILRDMNKKLGKKVNLDVIGEETEVDKNIIEKISDPLMHIIRNSIDHGIEDTKTRATLGKDPEGTIVLEAKNSGSDVLVIIKDDGKGLDKEKIYKKAYEQGIVDKPIEAMTDKEIYNLILKPGFSTNEVVTEFSGRGVGMDVVAQNINSIGGSVIVDSKLEVGTTIVLKIPLTLAIIEGMNIKVGASRFTIPITSIQESFRPSNKEVFKDTNGHEMIMVRGICYPIIRLHEFYDINTEVTTYEEGILIMVEEDDSSCCLLADELLGEQQVVVKALPDYIKQYKQIKGLGGCTLLGDGNISLILDIGNLYQANE